LHKGPKVRKYDKLSQMTGSPLQRAYTWLEPDEGKLSCPVLRGGSVSNDTLLPGFDRLAERVRDQLGCDPLSGHLFLFANARRTRLKVLVFDGSGLWVCVKRLEKGRYRWPESAASGRIKMRAEELTLLLNGIDLERARPRRWFRKVPA